MRFPWEGPSWAGTCRLWNFLVRAALRWSKHQHTHLSERRPAAGRRRRQRTGFSRFAAKPKARRRFRSQGPPKSSGVDLAFSVVGHQRLSQYSNGEIAKITLSSQIRETVVQLQRFEVRPPTQRFDLRTYNELQAKEILRHKWIESEKAGRDLGEEAVYDWIQRYAADFRQAHGWVLCPAEEASWSERLKVRLDLAFRWSCGIFAGR
jgi:hypothetical protein